MFVKFAIAVFCLAFASQKLSTEAKTVELELDTLENRGLLEEAIKALEALKVVLQNAIDGAATALEKILDGIRKLADKVIAETINKIQKEVQKLINRIEKLKEEAEKLGIDLAECFGDEIDRIKELERQLIKELIGCVTSQVEEAVGIVAETLLEIRSVWKVYEQLLKNLQNCKGDLACIIKVIADVADKTIHLPGAILGQVAKAKELIVSLQIDLIKCGTDVVLKVPIEGAKIIAEIVDCIFNRQQKIAYDDSY